ncbi:MAG: hypothetical protein A2X56_05130 [Nitrospirae bacterium GWC2_57_13]|nr:MAG: hypothetical protein A2072_00080 [Nitrospirae bacterium GWC1_57_7]OGW27278.1 MAG: hypothetical protein A2X56_05130 [Nitrospirae bacterium GWC2_57_13]OGW44963.1 MAG: hypothetical protein A2X57_06465 [Nitrospirae bacterium GWD2_57_8]
MTKYSISEVIEMALQTERLGFQFYTTIAEKFREQPELAKLFTTLASKEKVHERTFSELQEKVARNAPEPAQWEEVSDYMRAFVESEFFLGKGKSLPSMEGIKTPQDAVRFAMGFEKETLLYFMGLRSMVSEKAAVDAVIDEEKSHIVWLTRLQHSLKK